MLAPACLTCPWGAQPDDCAFPFRIYISCNLLCRQISWCCTIGKCKGLQRSLLYILTISEVALQPRAFTTHHITRLLFQHLWKSDTIGLHNVLCTFSQARCPSHPESNAPTKSILFWRNPAARKCCQVLETFTECWLVAESSALRLLLLLWSPALPDAQRMDLLHFLSEGIVDLQIILSLISIQHSSCPHNLCSKRPSLTNLCRSSNLLPSKASEMTATSKLAPHLHVTAPHVRSMQQNFNTRNSSDQCKLPIKGRKDNFLPS